MQLYGLWNVRLPLSMIESSLDLVAPSRQETRTITTCSCRVHSQVYVLLNLVSSALVRPTNSSTTLSSPALQHHQLLHPRNSISWTTSLWLLLPLGCPSFEILLTGLMVRSLMFMPSANMVSPRPNRHHSLETMLNQSS